MRLFITEAAAAWICILSFTTSMMEGSSDDDRLVAYCLLGGTLGSFAYILRGKIYEHDGLAAVVTAFGTNFLIGYIFSPLACDRICWALNTPMSFRICLAISGGIGLFSPWILTNKRISAFMNAISIRELAARIFGFKIDNDKGNPR